MFPLWELIKAVSATKATAQALRTGYNELLHIHNRGNVRLGMKNDADGRSHFHKLDAAAFGRNIGFIPKHARRICDALERSGLIQTRYKGEERYFRPRVLTRDGAVAYVEWLQRYGEWPLEPWWERDRNADPLADPNTEFTRDPQVPGVGPTGPHSGTHRSLPPGPTGPLDAPETRPSRGDDGLQKGRVRKREEKDKRSALLPDPHYAPLTAPEAQSQDPIGGAVARVAPTPKDRAVVSSPGGERCPGCDSPGPFTAHKGALHCGGCGAMVRPLTPQEEFGDD
jgi:hypothetical protein